MFSLDQVVALGGSAEAQARRRDALARAHEVGLPSFEEEVWRYTPIDDLVLSRYNLSSGPGHPPAPGLLGDSMAAAAAMVTLSDGHLVSVDIVDARVSVMVGDDADQAVSSVMGEAVDVFADYNLALSSAPIWVRVAPNVVLDGPVVVQHTTTLDGLAVFPRLVVTAGENSEFTVLEHHQSDDVEVLICPVTELAVGRAARVRHLTVQELGPRVWQIASQRSDIDRDAHLVASQVALGGGYARARIDTRMVGPGSTGDINAVYFGRGDAQLDFRTFQQHVAPHTTSNLLFKGAVDDRSRAIYTGMIRIEPDAHHVAAYQTNRNLKLSDQAWAESVPNLEIENNDVTCSHASAVGPVDADQQFYLESRGVPAQLAEALVVKGFFAEVLERLPEPEVGRSTADRISELLSIAELEGALS